MFYCGIDIAKRNHEASVIDFEGKPLLDSITITNTQVGCDKLFSLFERLNIAKTDIIIGMEATGHYWLPIYECLEEQNFDVHVINPIQSDAFRKMYIRQTKNDSKDSFIIAQVMRFGQYSETTLSDENIVALRQLSRFRLALVDNCGDCKRRIIALLDQVFPEYETLFSDIFCSSSRELLFRCPTPEDMLSISTKKLTALLNKASHGHFGEGKAKEIRDVASTSFGVGFAKMLSHFKSGNSLNNSCSRKARLKNWKHKSPIYFTKPIKSSPPSPASVIRWALSPSAKSAISTVLMRRANWWPLLGWM